MSWHATPPSSSRTRIEARRVTVGTSGAPTVFEPATMLVDTDTVDPGQPHDLVWTGSTTAVVGWADLRWSDTEIYDETVTFPACHM